MTTRALIDPERLVRSLYLAILRREPEPEALVHWTAKLDQGVELNEVIGAFLNSAEFRNQQAAPRLAYPPGHFYSPIVDAAQIAPEFARRSQQPVPATLPGIPVSLEQQDELWHCMLPFLREIPFPDEPADGFRYHFSNPNYSYGDGSVLYAMLRLFEPSRLIEIGSGFSSACSLDTIERYLGGRVKVTLVEPHADLLRKVLGSRAMQSVDLHEVPVQEVSLNLFAELSSSDILFIDSTHVMKTGSDVCRELFDILPSLAPGVFVHFHDIFWPFEYGENWVLTENRSWNEIYALRAFLMYNNEFEIVFFNDFFRRWRRDLILDTYPKFLNNTGGALWLRKR